MLMVPPLMGAQQMQKPLRSSVTESLPTLTFINETLYNNKPFFQRDDAEGRIFGVFPPRVPESGSRNPLAGRHGKIRLVPNPKFKRNLTSP